MTNEAASPSGRPEAGWVKRLAKALLALFFRRVEVTGLDAIPKGSGGLLIAWHPNGLIDPALVLATFPGRVVFGARHGLFRWPILRASPHERRRADLSATGHGARRRWRRCGGHLQLAPQQRGEPRCAR